MRFLEHDRVVKYLGHAVEHGIVVKALNRLTREYFPIVWIVDGPRKDTREYTSKGWRPVIDWEPQHLACRCQECGREFRAPKHLPFCRTCAEYRPDALQRPARDPETAEYQSPTSPYLPVPDDDDLPF
jgi:hypothetical protein